MFTPVILKDQAVTEYLLQHSTIYEELIDSWKAECSFYICITIAVRSPIQDGGPIVLGAAHISMKP